MVKHYFQSVTIDMIKYLFKVFDFYFEGGSVIKLLYIKKDEYVKPSDRKKVW